MNVGKVFLSGVLIASSLVSATSNRGVYYSELRTFKKDVATREIFDEDAHSGLSKIQRDITIYKNLGIFQRFVRSLFFMFDVVVVTPETMPKLYGYVEDLCKKANIKIPTIFVTRERWLLNAAAQKILMSSGAIIIGQKLMHDVSDNALEAIVAHEIGHIKYDHVNKSIALSVGRYACFMLLCKILGLNEMIFANSHAELQSKLKIVTTKKTLLNISLYLALWLIMDKRFEKEADEFACQNGKSQGIIEFFELMLQKEELREEEFVAIKKLLQENWSELSLFDNTMLRLRYYVAKGGHLCDKAFEYLYHHTPLGAHPSPEARIKAAKKYLQQEA